MDTEKIQQLTDALRLGVVMFTFTKKDGSIREAKGTLNMAIIGDRGGEIPAGDKKRNEDVITFWDMDKMGWRCCRKDSIDLEKGFRRYIPNF